MQMYTWQNSILTEFIVLKWSRGMGTALATAEQFWFAVVKVVLVQPGGISATPVE